MDPGQVHDAVHGEVRDFGSEFDIGAIEGRERQDVERQIRRRVAQIAWKPAGQRGLVRTRNCQLAGATIPTAVDRGRNAAEAKPTAEAIAETPQDAGREGLSVGWIERNQIFEQRLEVLGASVHGKSPDILQSEVSGDFADAPGARFVCFVRKPY